MKKKDGLVNFAMMGDSRVRNLYQYFEFLNSQECYSCNMKLHYNRNLTFENINFKIDFIWGPQTETGSQYVLTEMLNLFYLFV
jgi:hypothetical protein